MIYLLDNMVSFCTINANLQNEETGDELHLPPSAAFILTTLISHHGEILSREMFFDIAWNESGFKLSGNTLNQQISLLRKNLSLLGVNKNVIITVPRMGFALSEDIVIEIKFDDKPSPAKFKSGHSRILLSAVALIILIQCTWLIKEKITNNIYNPILLGRHESCDIYSSSNLSKGYERKAKKIVADFASKYLPCLKNEVYIFDTSGSFLFLNDGRSFLSRCDISPNGIDFIGCQEVLIYEKIQSKDDNS